MELDLELYCKLFRANSIKIEHEIETGSMDFLVEFARIGIEVSCVIKEFVKEELERNKLHQIPVYQSLS